MALFIHQENQKILWSAINQSILFQNLGDSRETWFRNAVEQFYKKISSININQELLQKINKDFIQDMLKVLKTNQPIAQPVQPPTPPQFYQPNNSQPSNSQPSNSQPSNSQQSNSQQSNYQPNSSQPSNYQSSNSQHSNYQPNNSQQSNSYYNPNPSYYDPPPSRYLQPPQLQQHPQQPSNNIQYSLEPTNTVSRDYLADQKQSEINKQFTSRLDQYNNMIAKNIPVANFKEGQMDEPITNMDALIKQHMIDRDQVLQYDPPPTSNQINNTSTNSPPILKIQETLDKPIENIIEFRTDDSPNMINQIKNVNQQGNSVHWSANQDSIFALKTKVDYIAEELIALKTELRDEFTKGFSDLRTFLLSQQLKPHEQQQQHQHQYIQSDQSPAPLS